MNSNLDLLLKNFITPPDETKSRPLWFWNESLDKMTKEGIYEIMLKSKLDSGYQGFGILPKWIDGYMSDKYLDLYEYALDTAKELNMKMCLYDENGFPSGSAGGILNEKYPEYTVKRLDKTELKITGPAQIQMEVPKGLYRTYLGTVAIAIPEGTVLDVSDKNRLNKTDSLEESANDLVTINVPNGNWILMSFATIKDGYDRVDYLSYDAVNRFIEVTHAEYYKKFSKYFGNVIDSAFYDEPPLYQAKGRTWTGTFNVEFELIHGYNPIIHYPALWGDFNAETVASRNILLSFRTELFATNYIKQMNDWCNSKGIKLTGHMDQEEVINPVSTCGDLMKVFKYQDIPGIDEIFLYDRARKAYKIVSSAAYNYDKQLVMTETYGAMGEDIGIINLYKDIINQFTKGINYIVPHAVWYENKNNVTFPPELSFRSEIYGKHLKDYNDFISRTSHLLQQGAHVADIAILYPIDNLQAAFQFDTGDPYLGSVIPEEADYMDVGDLLSTKIYQDFTYIHPEVMQECIVRNNRLIMNNKVNRESFSIVIIPGCKVISMKALTKIKEFYDNGGIVIATSCLPNKSSELGHDDDVRSIINHIFNGYSTNKRSFFLGKDYHDSLYSLLSEIEYDRDIYFEGLTDYSDQENGYMSYIHKRTETTDIYYIGNSSDKELKYRMNIKNENNTHMFSIYQLNPHNGDVKELKHEKTSNKYIGIDISIPSASSLFIVCER